MVNMDIHTCLRQIKRNVRVVDTYALVDYTNLYLEIMAHITPLPTLLVRHAGHRSLLSWSRKSENNRG